jgi:hypothetical protein
MLKEYSEMNNKYHIHNNLGICNIKQNEEEYVE